MQKIKLAIRGWNRRREEKQQEFLQQNVWSPGLSRAVQPAKAGAPSTIDFEGLVVAYLDDSGRIQYYLDAQTGDVVESHVPMSGDRYRRVPTRAGDERTAFLATLDDSGARARLASAQNFRSELARDRALERAWYNFRNDRAIAAIENWLREIGLR